MALKSLFTLVVIELFPTLIIGLISLLIGEVGFFPSTRWGTHFIIILIPMYIGIVEAQFHLQKKEHNLNKIAIMSLSVVIFLLSVYVAFYPYNIFLPEDFIERQLSILFIVVALISFWVGCLISYQVKIPFKRNR